MGKYKISISFDTKFLNSLVHTEKSRVEIQRRKHHLALHPIHFNNLNESIKELLNEGVAKYSNDLNGILLGYRNIKLLGGGGMFHDDTCYTHCDVEADFFVFKPEIDEEMKGVVIRKSKDHVGLLVYNTFNVSIPAPRDQDDWLGKSVQIGYEVLFKIVHFSFTSYLPYLKGELISILTEVDSCISNETTTNSKQKKNNKKINFSGDSFSEELSIRESESHEVSPKKKKSKKNKSFESDMEISVIESELKNIGGVSLSPSKKKKKRTKKCLDASKLVSDSENFLEVSPKKKKSKKNKSFESEMEVNVIESELKAIEGVSLSPSKKKEKRTKKVKLEPSESVSDSENILEVSENKNSKKRKDSVRENLELVGDLENSFDVSESIKTKKRKLSIGDTEETPKRKKKKHSL
ncbi:RNA polymerase I subunit F [Leptinotarsa decemlineata]|uniref:RNA polymerase I subunit F n=1 Tax=Leptinotarsa decemlineata TaxID=7539 RepID=UPI000C2527DA|nr:DNA-directed RNA polymerase I subunit RPA43 [Leptinotarsa decemlineata]